MLFNSWEFLVFFPVVVVIYLAIPKKIKHVWLLITSCFFYMCWNPGYILLIGFSVAATYLSGRLLDRFRIPEGADEAARRKLTRIRKLVVAGCFVLNLLILVFFKYRGFLLDNLNRVLLLFRLRPLQSRFSFVLPVGISFYTFQALGYTMDVYRGETAAERNFLKYALFVSFFPQLVAGPIERSKNLLADIHGIPEKKLLDYDRITRGLMLMLYGLFLKLVIADRISVAADAVFGASRQYSPLMLWLGAVCFAIQIYCDFASYSAIAIGAARVMGFTLMENFDTPYFARSVREFWRRWHISLSTWFRDYLYFPLGGSRRAPLRNAFNLMVVFVVSGLWHGASWHFIAWGFLNGFYQLFGQYTQPARTKLLKLLRVNTESAAWKLLRTLVTFALITMAWVLFRADSLSEAGAYLYRMVTGLLPGRIFPVRFGIPGFSTAEWIILAAALGVLLFADLVKYNRHQTIDGYLAGRPLWQRWLFLYLLLFAVIIFGKYGPEYSQQAFIYFQF